MRHIILHGHFYQPPRENPWTERVPRESSASPFHDWNVRVSRESYAPNAAARLLDGQGRILELANNYDAISFNFGPTLVDWLARHQPELLKGLQEADRRSRDGQGYGNAMAQVYGHAILPLLTPQDRETQVIWGLAHFEHTFGRPAEGIWLAETAADTETLNLLARLGVKFTVLAPWQLDTWREGDGEWRSHPGRAGLGRAFRYQADSEASLALFFYDGELAQQVAFGDALTNGKRFGESLLSEALSRPEEAPLLHVATDGETYGHHHRFGEMALAVATGVVAGAPGVSLTNYAAYLSAHPPTAEARILSPGSWSCAHGVGRWHRNCGCSTGGEAGWNQAWREPLYDALVYLRDVLDQAFETEGVQVLKDGWAARNAYIHVLLDPSEAARTRFLAEQAHSGAGPHTIWRLLEMQRHRMLMFTSCGWFFNDLAGIETLQILRYAGRALDLASEPVQRSARPEFLRRLGEARSNRPPHPTGADLFEKAVREVRVSESVVAAEAALRQRFGLPAGPGETPGAYRVEFAGEDPALRVDVIHRRLQTTHRYAAAVQVDPSPRVRVELTDLEGGTTHSIPLEELDPEASESVVRRVLEQVGRRAERGMKKLVAQFDPVIAFLEHGHLAPPAGLKRLLESAWVGALLDEIDHAGPEASASWEERVLKFHHLGLDRDDQRLANHAERRLAASIRAWVETGDPDDAQVAFHLLDLCDQLSVTPDLWEAQNAFSPSWRNPGHPTTDPSIRGRLAARLVFAVPKEAQ